MARMQQLQTALLPGDEPNHLHKCRRKPLQPKNCFLAAHELRKRDAELKPKPDVSLAGDLNKENRPIAVVPTAIQPFDASLAEELSAIRKKNERLRLDRERTDSLLEERGRAMDLKMEEVRNRGEIQKILEIEVDRLFRLMELHSASMRISPIRSLRERERDKRNSSAFAASPLNMDQQLKTEDLEESVGENTIDDSDSDSSGGEVEGKHK